MKTPLALPNSEIIENVQTLFNVQIAELSFLPVGESSWTYIARDTMNQSVIVKIQKTIAPAPGEVLGELAKQGYKWVPNITLSKHGNMWEERDGLSYSLQQYVPADRLLYASSQPDGAFLLEVGRLLKDLHAVTIREAALRNVATETFEPEVVRLARVALARLEKSPAPNDSIKAVRGCLRERAGAIEQLFHNLARYGSVLKRQQSSVVITHGDFHFGNIIQPANDHLYLVDWDQTMLALPELDLMYLDDEQIATISEGYGRNLLENRAAIQYYRNYLLLRALWFWLNKILDADPDEQSALAATIVEIFSDSPYFARALKSNSKEMVL